MTKKITKFLIALVLIGQFWLHGVTLGGISTPAYLLLLVALGAFVSLDALFNYQQLKIGKTGILSILLLATIVMAFVINAKIDMGRLLLIFFSFLFAYACTISIKKKEDINFLFNLYIVIVLISSIVAIGQSLEIDFFIELWRQFHTTDKIDSSIAAKRYLGLASDILQFGYQVSTAFIITLFAKFKKHKWLKWILVPVFAYAVFINDTRSAWIVTVLAIVVWIFRRPNRKVSRALIFVGGIIVVVLVAMLVIESGVLGNTRFSANDSGTTARFAMLLTAFNHALYNPFGLGAYSVDPNLVVGASADEFSYVVSNTAHNLIGNCVASYGFIGLILMIMLYVNAYKNYRRSKSCFEESNEYFIAFLCLIGLAINAFFHNSYILNGELSSFMFFGILATVPRITVAEDEKNKLVLSERKAFS